MKILVAYDGSACAEAAVADIGRAGIPQNSEVLVICVVDTGGAPTRGSDFPAGEASNSTKADLSEGRALADTAHKWIQSNFPGWRVSRQVLSGPPAAVILEKARSWGPDLIIAGSHGRSLVGRVLHGSLSQKIAHEAPCSVRLVCAAKQSNHRPLHIVVGCDPSPEAASILHEVAQRSWPEDSEVRIVSVIHTIVPIAYDLEPNAFAAEPALNLIQDSVEQRRARFQEIVKEAHESFQNSGLIVTAVEIEGDPKRDLVAEAERWNADTIFVGARGRGRLEELLLGSVSTAVLMHAHCAVEVVRRVS